MLDDDAPEVPEVSRRDDANRPKRRKSARAQRNAGRKKGRGTVKAVAAPVAAKPVSLSAPEAGSEPELPFAAAANPPRNEAPAEAIAAAAIVPRNDETAAAVEASGDPEALALSLWEAGRKAEAVELLERELAIERVRARKRVLEPAEVDTGEAGDGNAAAAILLPATLAAQPARAEGAPTTIDLVPGPRNVIAAASRRASPVALMCGAAIVCLFATGILWADSEGTETQRAGLQGNTAWPTIASVTGGPSQPNVLLPESLKNLTENAAAARAPIGGEDNSGSQSAAEKQAAEPLLPVEPNRDPPVAAEAAAEAPASAAEAPLVRSVMQPLTPGESSGQAPVDALAASETPAGGAGPAELSANEPPASVAPNNEPPGEILAGAEAPFAGMPDAQQSDGGPLVAGDDPDAETPAEDLALADDGMDEVPTDVAEARIPRPRPEPTRTAAYEPAYEEPAPYYEEPPLAYRRAMAERYVAMRRAAAERRAFWGSRIIVLRGRPYQ